jgi:tartrate dehydratase beta subunit/fumarate hydratase class I family protein
MKAVSFRQVSLNGEFSITVGQSSSKTTVERVAAGRPFERRTINGKSFAISVCRGVIGKGGMGDKTLAACKEHGCVYLHGVGGAAQVLAQCIKKVANVYFMEEFGAPEAIWEFEVVQLPAVVTIDAHGNSLHKEVFAASEAELAKYL